jgi:hypothetical protein
MVKKSARRTCRTGLGHPDHSGFNVIAVQHLGINNLPKPAKDAIAELLGRLPELLEGLLQAGSASKSTSSPGPSQS